MDGLSGVVTAVAVFAIIGGVFGLIAYVSFIRPKKQQVAALREVAAAIDGRLDPKASELTFALPTGAATLRFGSAGSSIADRRISVPSTVLEIQLTAALPFTLRLRPTRVATFAGNKPGEVELSLDDAAFRAVFSCQSNQPEPASSLWTEELRAAWLQLHRQAQCPLLLDTTTPRLVTIIMTKDARRASELQGLIALSRSTAHELAKHLPQG